MILGMTQITGIHGKLNIDKMKSILVLGGLGMLGSQVLIEFAESNYKITATYRNQKDLNLFKNKYKQIFKQIIFKKFDICLHNEAKLKKLIKNNKFIINCAGIIKPHIKENNLKSMENAIYVNSIFPHKLNSLAKGEGVKIYQIATDCVYSGIKGKYCEKDHHDCIDVYGKSKSLGEVKDKNFFNIRCSIIGIELKNKMSLIEWFKLSKINSKLRGFHNHKWNGITTTAYAKIVRTIIEKNIKIPNSINIVPKNEVTKYQLLLLFQKVFKRRDLNIKKVNSKSKINRTLKTIYFKKNLEIWNKSIYSGIPNIQKLIKELN